MAHCGYNKSPCKFYGSECPIIKCGEDNPENRKVRDNHERDYCFSQENHGDCPTGKSLKSLDELDDDLP